MTDPEMWNVAVAAVAAELDHLPPAGKGLLVELTAAVKECKSSLHDIAEGVQAGAVCADCAGECCRSGKYHFTIVDLLVYLVEAKEPFTPRFDQGLCPYLGDRGCLMPPDKRPFNCITFNCELVERLLEPSEKERFARLERELRELYRRFEELFGNRFMGGLLLNCERDLLRDRLPILRIHRV